MAAQLIDLGFEIVRPLEGGFEAWIDARYPLDPPSPLERPADPAVLSSSEADAARSLDRSSPGR